MSVQGTLRKVDNDIAADNLRMAENRLNGLLSRFPANLEVRRRLGDVHWRLGHPHVAGAYWYLEPPGNEQQRAARNAFIEHTGNRPVAMLQVIRFEAPLTALEEGCPARQALQDLADRAKAEQNKAIVFPYPYGSHCAYPPPAPTPHIIAAHRKWIAAQWIGMVGCVALLLATVSLTAIGAWTVFRWIFSPAF